MPACATFSGAAVGTGGGDEGRGGACVAPGGWLASGERLAQATRAGTPTSAAAASRNSRRRPVGWLAGMGGASTTCLSGEQPPILAIPMSVDPLRVLRALAACPTAPFHEAYVAARARELCAELGLTCDADDFGNLLIRPDVPGAATGPIRIAFSAHMDHPGLEVISAGGDSEGHEIGRLLGSVDQQCFRQPVPVRLITAMAEVNGHIVESFTVQDETHLRLEAEHDVPAGTLGVFDVGSFQEDGDMLLMPAADDLAGCAAIIAALAGCRERGVAGALGVLTRAEEVSLAGATLLARSDRLPRDAVIVSVEASRPRPGAEMGGGAVIRAATFALPSIQLASSCCAGRQSAWPTSSPTCPYSAS